MSDQATNCGKVAIVHQLLKVGAQVTVKPIVKHGRPRAYCIDSHIKPGSDWEEKKIVFHGGKDSERSDGKCTFTVTQVVCVEIPIAIGVDVDVDEGILRCGTPKFGPCKTLCKEPEITGESEGISEADDEG